ncbi:MAG: DPP IV N-terminal domain-containing protein [Planctomycetota bacterium]
MNHRVLFTFALLFLLWLPGADGLGADESSEWRQPARDRLEAIYDRGEFRVPNIEVQWFDDSSGYRVRETDSASGKPVVASYVIATGKRGAGEWDRKPGPRRSPDQTKLVETRNGNLFLRDVDSDEERPMTENPEDRDLSFREIRWHPSGRFISFVAVDRSEVQLRSVLVPKDPSYPGVREDRFARVGGKIEERSIGVFSLEHDELTWVSLPAPSEGFYLGAVEWVPGTNQLLIEVLSRFRDRREFWLASTEGAAESIYREVNEAWAVGSHGINSGTEWIRGGTAFIFISEKEGWRQAYLRSRDGKNETKLTLGDYDIIDRAFVDEVGGWYYFYASPENGTQKYLHRVPLDGSGTLERLSPDDQPGTHDYIPSPDRRYAIHTYSTLNDPPVVNLVELPGHRVVRQIRDQDELRRQFKSVVPRPTEFTRIDIGNEVVMDACITKPRDFDGTKKYPVLVYVYGEPYLQTVLDRWGAAQTDFHRVVADAGYVVVSIDNRGTACPKGAAWRRSIFGSLGPLSTEDQATALKQLAKDNPYLDLSRVAIWGWSGGGSNTLNAMFRKPDVYHVGIAVVPKPQPWLYNAWFQEIYMRTREVNAEGYQRSAPINFAEGLRGKLLIITGSGETNTHIQIIEGLVDRLIELGKPFDYMVYPNRDHGLREGKGSVVHVRMKILRYLIENLPPGPR